MLDRLNSLSVAAPLPYFLTMTLPDEVFNDDVAEFAKSAKHWMDVLLKRLRRVSPKAAGFWRIEWQSRKSGVHEGKLVPHFHLLVWGLAERLVSDRVVDDGKGGRVLQELWEAVVSVPDRQLHWDLVKAHGLSPERADWQSRCETDYEGQRLVFSGSRQYVARCRGFLTVLSLATDSEKFAESDVAKQMAFQDWVSLAWYHVVASGNVNHLMAGVRVEHIKSWGGVMSYCAKYLAKADCGFLYGVAYGRNWGIFNRSLVPWARLVEIDLDPEVGNRLRRIIRRYMERKRGRRIRSPFGITLYGDVAKWRRLWRPDPPPDPF
jgi:hypothetical protein